MFCKFVVGIRHLSIKIIYASRTGQMIVLDNHINPIIQIKNQITTMLFAYVSPVLMPFIYTFQFALLDNVQFIPPWRFIPQQGGILHFDFMYRLPNPGYAFHSHIPLKIHLTETCHFITSPPLVSSPQNCTKSPHNSINHFDNHFDTYPKYPSTNINNKLSDNYKIHTIPQNPIILRPNHTYKSHQLISKIFTNQATFHNNPAPSKCFDLSNSSENHLL